MTLTTLIYTTGIRSKPWPLHDDVHDTEILSPLIAGYIFHSQPCDLLDPENGVSLVEKNHLIPEKFLNQNENVADLP